MAPSVQSPTLRTPDHTPVPSLYWTIYPLCRDPKMLRQTPQCRITTKYRISSPPPPRKRKAPLISDSTTTASSTPPKPASQQQQPPAPLQSRAHIVLKTYDPASGVCLKYKTDKAAEVGRLVVALGKCGRLMAGLPAKDEAAAVDSGGAMEVDGKAEEVETKPAGGGKEGGKSGAQPQVHEQGKGGGGRKKKGKR
ncbi:MAG: hypothetical protein Q9220_003535 [cf. Caloplaca sp. 1 TL-2023]